MFTYYKTYRGKVKLTFTANADTTVPVYYTKESFIAKKPDETISLTANEQKTTVINKTEIYRFGVVDYNPSTGKYISSNTNIISARIEGIILDGYRLFDRAAGLVKANLTKMNTKFMTSMFCMFNDCNSLTSVGDLANWNISNVTDMRDMFCGCNSLTSVGDLSKWDTSKVTNMWDMFYGCNSFEQIDVNNWNMSNVQDVSYMFGYPISQGGNHTTKILNLGKWDVNHITDDSKKEYCFNGLMSLEDIYLDKESTSLEWVEKELLAHNWNGTVKIHHGDDIYAYNSNNKAWEKQ